MSTYSFCCQYHIHRIERHLCLGDEPSTWFADGPRLINTKKQAASRDYFGSTCFMFMVIGGTPKLPLHNFLWKAFDVRSVAPQSRGEISGHGWMLNPPQLLDRDLFDELFAPNVRRCFKPLNADSAVARRLEELAKTYHRPNVFDFQSVEFCSLLLRMIPDEPQAIDLARYVTQMAVKQGIARGNRVAVNAFEKLRDATKALVNTAKKVRSSLDESDLRFLRGQLRILDKHAGSA